MLVGCWPLGPVIVLTTRAPCFPTPVTNITEFLAFLGGLEERGTELEVLVPRHSTIHLTVFHYLPLVPLAPRDDGHIEF